jgi:hypothetical protein
MLEELLMASSGKKNCGTDSGLSEEIPACNFGRYPRIIDGE